MNTIESAPWCATRLIAQALRMIRRVSILYHLSEGLFARGISKIGVSKIGVNVVRSYCDGSQSHLRHQKIPGTSHSSSILYLLICFHRDWMLDFQPFCWFMYLACNCDSPGPLVQYRSLVEQGKLQHDPYQESVASELENLLARLEQYDQEMKEYYVKLNLDILLLTIFFYMKYLNAYLVAHRYFLILTLRR